MKTPRSVIVAVVFYAIMIVSRFWFFVTSWETITPVFIVSFLVTHTVLMVGIIGLLLKKKWSRKFTIGLFIFIVITNFSFLNQHSKEFDVPNLIFGIVSIAVCIYVFHHFYTDPDIQTYLKN